MSTPLFHISVAVRHPIQLTDTAPPDREYAEGIGRAEASESIFDGTSQDITEQNEGLAYYFEMAKDPYIWAGLQAVMVNGLWVSAAGLEDEENDTYFPSQLKPYSDESQDQEMWEFLAWNLDERLERDMSEVLRQIQLSYMIYGRAIQEIIWSPGEDTPFGQRHVIADIKDRDPDRFLINPPGLPPGLYLKENTYSTNVTLAHRMPDKKFLLVTNNRYFENPYGQSELTPLVGSEYGKRNVQNFWSRHLEKFGSPQIDATYPSEREGSQHATWRANRLNELKSASHQAILFHSERLEIQALQATGENQGFKDYIDERNREISLVLTGSATTLQEGKYGSYSREEATSVRAKSEKEKQHAGLLQDAFNYQLLVWLTDYNYQQVDGYAFLQLIPPELITPTTPEGQKNIHEIEEEQEPEENPIDAPHQESYALQFQGEEEDEEQDEEEPVSRQFPNPVDIPEYDDRDVQREGKKHLATQPVLTRDEFDKLPPEAKRLAFTITPRTSGRGGKGIPIPPEALQALHDAILQTLSIPNEKDAWESYKEQARAILKEYNISGIHAERDLAVSFRMARQQGFVLGIWEKAQQLNAQDRLYALQYVAMDDSNVRLNHKMMDTVIQPIDSEFWEVWLPLNGFNCRCFPRIITMQMYQDAPEKYPITDWNTAILPDKGFYEENE